MDIEEQLPQYIHFDDDVKADKKCLSHAPYVPQDKHKTPGLESFDLEYWMELHEQIKQSFRSELDKVLLSKLADEMMD